MEEQRRDEAGRSCAEEPSWEAGVSSFWGENIAMG